MHNLIKRPVVSEKSMGLTKQGLYTFETSLSMTKEAVAKLVKDKFKVEVVSVKSIKTPGKTKLQRNRRGYFKTADTKKMIVQVKKGQRILLFEEIINPKDDEDVKVTRGEESEPVVKEEKKRLGGPKVTIERSEPKKKATKKAKEKTK